MLYLYGFIKLLIINLINELKSYIFIFYRINQIKIKFIVSILKVLFRIESNRTVKPLITHTYN